MKASLRKCQNWTFMRLSGVTSNISAVRFGAFRAPARVTFGRCSKSDQKNSLNLRFKNPRMLCSVYNLVPCTARSQNTVDFVAYDVLTFALRRCRSCGATVERKALYGGAMWASRPTKFYRWLVRRAGRLYPAARQAHNVLLRTIQRQRRWSRDDPFNQTKRKSFVNVWYAVTSSHRI